MSSAYHFRSRIYENPSLQPNFLAIRARMQLHEDHIFFYMNLRGLLLVKSKSEVNSRICIKITIVNGFDQLFSHFDNLLTTSWWGKRRQKKRRMRNRDELNVMKICVEIFLSRTNKKRIWAVVKQHLHENKISQRLLSESEWERDIEWKKGEKNFPASLTLLFFHGMMKLRFNLRSQWNNKKARPRQRITRVACR